MRDVVISALASLVLLALLLNGVRVRVQNTVTRMTRAIRDFRMLEPRFARPSAADVRESVRGLMRSTAERPLSILALFIISTMPWMVTLRDHMPPNAQLGYTVAALLAFGCLVVSYNNEDLGQKDLGGVFIRVFVTTEMLVVMGVGGVESIATAASNGTFNLVLYLALLGWVPCAILALVKKIADRTRSFLGKAVVVVVGLLGVGALVFTWSGSYFIGIGAAPADVLEGSLWEMLSGIIVVGLAPPRESMSRGVYLGYRAIVFVVQTVIVGVFVSYLADSLHPVSDKPQLKRND